MVSKKISILNFFSYVSIVLILVFMGKSFFFHSSKTDIYFKLTFYEAIYMLIIIINIILLIEIYNVFVKKLEENKKKEEFIFKQLELLVLDLQVSELKKIESEEDYKKYLLIQKKIRNRLDLIDKICKEYKSGEGVSNLIEQMKNNFEEYRDFSSEKITSYCEFNKEILKYEKYFQNIEKAIYNLQGMILGFKTSKEE